MLKSLLIETKFYPSFQFAFFRVLLGLYLSSLFYNTLIVFDDFRWVTLKNEEPASVYFVYLGLICSLLLTIGLVRKICAVFIWIILNYLIYKNIFFNGVNLDYIGFLLIVTLLVNSNESFNKKNDQWSMNSLLYTGVWITFLLGMTVSGINKVLISEIWLSGEVASEMFGPAPISESIIMLKLTAEFPSLFTLLTYITLFLEIAALLFIFNKHLRFFYTISSMIIYLAIAMFLTMRDVALAVLLVKIFLFDWSYFFEKNHK